MIFAHVSSFRGEFLAFNDLPLVIILIFLISLQISIEENVLPMALTKKKG